MILALLLANTVAVLELRNSTDLNAPYLADQVRAAVKAELPAAKVITRENMLVLLQASGKDLANCEGECEVDTARRIGADLVVSGELLKFGTQYKLNLKLHDVRSGELLAGAVAAGTTADDLDKAVAPAVGKLLAPLQASQPAPPREGGLIGLQLHAAFGYGALTTSTGQAPPDPTTNTNGNSAWSIGGDVTYHALPWLWVGPWFDVFVHSPSSAASDSFLFGALARAPAGPVWVAGAIGYAILPGDNGLSNAGETGWSAMLEADWPVWRALALHAQFLVAHGAVGIGLVSGDDALYAGLAGLSLVF